MRKIIVILYQDETIGFRDSETQKEARITLEDAYILALLREGVLVKDN